MLCARVYSNSSYLRVPKVIKVTLGRLGQWGRLDHQVLLGQRVPEELLVMW